jgi:hypothetical protein
MVVERMRHAEFGVLGHATGMLTHGLETALLKNLKPPNRLRRIVSDYDARSRKKPVCMAVPHRTFLRPG